MGPRVAMTSVMAPNGAEVLFFGGEYFNGQHVTVYNDLYRYELFRSLGVLMYFRFNLNKFEQSLKSKTSSAVEEDAEDEFTKETKAAMAEEKTNLEEVHIFRVSGF